MIKCNEACIPCCDFCIYAVHETFFDEELGGDVYGGPIHCEKHPDEEHDMICESCGYCDDFHCFKAKNEEKTRAERRHTDFRKAIRKKKITKTWNDGHDYYSNLHQYSKNKIHCSCPMCSIKTNNKNRSGARGWEKSKNWSTKDKKRIEDMKEQENEE